MSLRTEALRRRMEAAAAALDFEEAGRLRDQLSLLQGAPDEEGELPELEGSRLARQRPGAMGLGSSDQVFQPPSGWTPPKKPDPLTRSRRPRRGPR